MKTSDFDYAYPEELVAQRPLPCRHASRMMVLDRASGRRTHLHAGDLPGLLRGGDVVVVNDTRVAAARVFGRRGGGDEVEILLVEQAGVPGGLWRCLARRPGRIRDGEEISFGGRTSARARGRDGAHILLEFPPGGAEVAIEACGVPPLPPYIRRGGHGSYTPEDRERYQTVYAERTGSAAAPTAGLHLSREVMDGIAGQGAAVVRITLHIGIDTFSPVREEDPARHRMHGERVSILPDAAREIGLARAEGRRIIAVGTTAARALESAAGGGGIRSGEWVTDLFIRPGHGFKMVDALLTNFHQPRSTLLMLVSAFAGRELILSSYEEAIRLRYRLFSYGDCMLIV
jgi:S-adenosylmethionine:tRNA ribosyltransferase-isomerase